MEQKKLGIRFGAVAVLKGWLKQQTVDYFLSHLKASMAGQSVFSSDQVSKQSAQRILEARGREKTKTGAKVGHAHDRSSQKGHGRVKIKNSVLELPQELITSPKTIDPFASDDENFDLASLMEMDDGNICL